MQNKLTIYDKIALPTKKETETSKVAISTVFYNNALSNSSTFKAIFRYIDEF